MMGTLSDKYIITAIGFRLAKVSEQKGDKNEEPTWNNITYLGSLILGFKIHNKNTKIIVLQ